MSVELNNSIKKVEELISAYEYTVEDTDLSRPWGAFFRLKNTDAENFIDRYFPELKDDFDSFENLSPKFLIVAPHKRLSWQYHYNRAEHWKVLEGPVGVKLSEDDNEPSDVTMLNENDLVQFEALKRHRLIGLESYGIVAEIWQHVNPNTASDESDIVRVSDDFSR